jgi:hypothetical protein
LNLKYVLVPKDAWRHVFASERPLPEFTQLHIRDTGPTLTDVGLVRLAAACPNLTQFSSDGCLAGRLTALQPLSALTKLSVDPAGDKRVIDVAELTGLRDLTIRTYGSNLAETSIMQLSALRHLTHFHLDCYQPACYLHRPCHYPLLNKVGKRKLLGSRSFQP